MEAGGRLLILLLLLLLLPLPRRGQPVLLAEKEELPQREKEWDDWLQVFEKLICLIHMHGIDLVDCN